MSVNVFSTKVPTADTIFTSPTGDGAAILRDHPSHAKVQPSAGQRKYLHFSLILRPWVLVRSRKSNPRPPALQSSAQPTELILRDPYGSVMMPQKITAACLYLETSLWRQQIFLFLNFDYVLFPLVLDVVAQAKTIAAPSAITKETVLLQVRQIYSSTIGHYRLR